MPRAHADLAQHLEVVGGAHAQALGLEQLAVPLEPASRSASSVSMPSIAFTMRSGSVT